MDRIKKFVLWCVFGFILLLVCGSFNSIGWLFGLIAAALILPVDKWQAVLAKYLKTWVRVLIAVVLCLVMIFIAGSAMPEEQPEPPVSGEQTGEEEEKPEVETPEDETLKVETPVVIPDETPAEKPEESPVEPPVETPVETPEQKPAETHTHSFKAATCTVAKTCSCGATEGSALGHNWSNATCKTPKTCSRCKITDGGVADHKWANATCTKPKTCSVCGTQNGGTAAHNWVDATYSSDQKGNDKRVRLMERQVRQLFGTVPTDPEDYTLASQISQAEAKKYFIERMRAGRPHKTGIIWWNLLDGWPQMSDAVVDYYFTQKLAYDYIKRSQAPFCIVADEISNWQIKLMACNDTLQVKTGHFTVTDAETGELLLEKDFAAEVNTSTCIGELPVFYSDRKVLWIRWNADGEEGFNHYLCGYPPIDFAWYKRLMGLQ